MCAMWVYIPSPSSFPNIGRSVGPFWKFILNVQIEIWFFNFLGLLIHYSCFLFEKNMEAQSWFHKFSFTICYDFCPCLKSIAYFLNLLFSEFRKRETILIFPPQKQ